MMKYPTALVRGDLIVLHDGTYGESGYLTNSKDLDSTVITCSEIYIDTTAPEEETVRQD
jgi:hypothetical protein